ncbi:MAG: hypothetical protein J6P71_05795 [Oscillospiraceae bacterium]|nr:hypothetical protein [Oscillospiraceae bacterium]
MRDRLARLFYGRNGIDKLSTFLWVVGLVLLIISGIVRRFTSVGYAIWALAVVCIVLSFIRIFSRNVTKRAAENERYLSMKNSFLNFFRGKKARFEQRRDYKFFKCPECKSMLRVPRGKGRIYVTCRKCGARFEAKS